MCSFDHKSALHSFNLALPVFTYLTPMSHSQLVHEKKESLFIPSPEKQTTETLFKRRGVADCLKENRPVNSLTPSGTYGDRLQ